MSNLPTTYPDPVFGELPAEEVVGDEDLGDDVDEVEDLAEEELDGPPPVLLGQLLPLLHVLGHLGHLLVPILARQLVRVQPNDDVLGLRNRKTGLNTQPRPILNFKVTRSMVEAICTSSFDAGARIRQRMCEFRHVWTGARIRQGQAHR